MKRILIVNVNWLGDVILSTAFIRAVRDAKPDSYIACMIVSGCKDILEDNPCLNEIILYDEKGQDKGWNKKLQLIKKLKSYDFDTAFILRPSLSRTMLLKLAGIKKRIGYNNVKSGFLLTEKIAKPKENIHRAEYYLNIAKEVGINTTNKKCEYYVREKDDFYINELLAAKGINKQDYLIVINPGGNWMPKRWRPENFALVADALLSRYNVKVVISGAEKDKELAKYISLSMHLKPSEVCGEMNLKQLAALMKRADLVISNDSGPMHVAAALGTDLIAIFGPTLPQLTGPYGKGRASVLINDIKCQRPCYLPESDRCSEYECINTITVEDVLEKVALYIPDTLRRD